MSEQEFQIELNRREQALSLLMFVIRNNMDPKGILEIIKTIEQEFFRS